MIFAFHKGVLDASAAVVLWKRPIARDRERATRSCLLQIRGARCTYLMLQLIWIMKSLLEAAKPDVHCRSLARAAPKIAEQFPQQQTCYGTWNYSADNTFSFTEQACLIERKFTGTTCHSSDQINKDRVN